MYERTFERNRSTMKALIGTLVQQADLSPQQAEQVASVVKAFLADKLPSALSGPVLGAIDGEAVDNVADQAKGMLGKLF